LLHTISLTLQIVAGTVLLLACTLQHGGTLVLAGLALRNLDRQLARLFRPLGWIIAMAVSVLAMIVSHSIHVWVWAVGLRLLGAFGHLEEAIYYAIVTYTTVGFGDVVLPESHRIFGAMASVTGLLAFGLSTAFLVGLFGRMLPRTLRGN
jgi:hypothetical protein